MKKILDILLKYWPLLVALSAFLAWGYNHDASLARAKDLATATIQIEQNKLLWAEERKERQQQFEDLRKTQRAETVQKQIWYIERDFKGKKMPDSVYNEYHKLKLELISLRKEGY